MESKLQWSLDVTGAPRVSGSFLWMIIWSLPGTLKLRNLRFLGSDPMDNLPKEHTLGAPRPGFSLAC